MNGGALVVDRAEQIKWARVIDMLNKELQMARECQHPDAQWLAALFPPGVTVSPWRMREVMLQNLEDPRAMFFYALTDVIDQETLEAFKRSAKLGYAPAQAELSAMKQGPSRIKWLERAVAQGDRYAMFLLGAALWFGRDCERDKVRGLELVRRAAELEHSEAEWGYGDVAFGELDWERFYWKARAASRGYNEQHSVSRFSSWCHDLNAWSAVESCT
jgi:TPR repeat protein